MSRWKIGDKVLRPSRGPREVERWGQSWEPAVVETIRGDQVVVRAYSWTYEHHEAGLKPKPAGGMGKHVRPHKRLPESR